MIFELRGQEVGTDAVLVRVTHAYQMLHRPLITNMLSGQLLEVPQAALDIAFVGSALVFQNITRVRAAAQSLNPNFQTLNPKLDM